VKTRCAKSRLLRNNFITDCAKQIDLIFHDVFS